MALSEAEKQYLDSYGSSTTIGGNNNNLNQIGNNTSIINNLSKEEKDFLKFTKFGQEESSVDYDNMIINLESIDDSKEQAEAFLKICFEIISYYNNIKIKPEVIEQLSLGWYQVLRMNNCFK